MEVGSYVTMGFVNGINGGIKDIESSSTKMAKSALDSTKKTISKLIDTINTDVDSQPTIRPVLDLSNVEREASRLNAMFSRDQAMSISTGMYRSNNQQDQNGVNEVRSGVTYQFTQNNYSPKALSRVEIYRQTKNQFSSMERMVKA